MNYNFTELLTGLGILVLIWFSLYFFYIEVIALPYFRKYFGIKKKLKDFNDLDRVKLIFYRRYQSFNVAAYFILLLSTLLLLLCTTILLYANDIITLNSSQTSATNEILKDKSLFLISSISIRVGIILIAFFIAQTLLKLYKYNLKMASFYTTLFDTLIAHESFKLPISQMIEIIRPSTIEDSELKLPQTELIEILKNLSENLNKK